MYHNKTVSKEKASGAKEARNKPSDLDGPGFSLKSYRPGYSLEKSLQGCSEDDLKRGFKKG